VEIMANWRDTRIAELEAVVERQARQIETLLARGRARRASSPLVEDLVEAAFERRAKEGEAGASVDGQEAGPPFAGMVRF
jgi:hypothetical protein